MKQVSNDGTNWAWAEPGTDLSAFRYVRDMVEVAEAWRIGPDGKPDYHEVRTMNGEKAMELFDNIPKPSPGPWRARSDDMCLGSPFSGLGDNWHIVDEKNWCIAELGGAPGTPRQTANAALIADAPVMLELLCKHEYWGTDDNGHLCCPECEMPADRKPLHHDGCAWGALLDKHGRTP